MKEHCAIIIRSQDKILFIQRSENKKTLPNIWAFPSGTIEQGETAEQTARREAYEELNITTKSEKILASVNLPELNTKLIFVVCEIESGYPSIKEIAEIKSLRWMTCEEFFAEYSDEHIGHGLIYLRKHPELWLKI